MTRDVLCVGSDLSALVDILESLGHELSVHTASSAAEALATCRRDSIDCLVCASQLPETDWRSVLEGVRSEWPELPFVVVFEGDSPDLASKVLAAGATDYVRNRGEEGPSLVAHRVEQVLAARSRQDYRDLIETVDDTITVYDPAVDDVDEVSHAVCDRLDVTSAVDCECAIEGVDLDGDASPTPVIATVLQRTLETGHHRVEVLCEPEDGKTGWADVQLERATIDGRDHVIVRTRDISEQKRREQEVASFRQAVEHAGHSIYVTDTRSEILYVNPAFERTTGYSADEAVGQTPALLKSGAHSDEYYQQLWSTILGGEVWQNELINERKDGSSYYVNQTIAPITDETGELVRFVAVNAEITEQKRREQQLHALYEATAEWLDAESRTEVCRMVSEQLSGLLEFDEHGFHLYNETTGRLEPVAVSTGTTVSPEEIPSFGDGDGIAWTVFETGEAKRYDDVRTDPDVYNPDTRVRSELLLPLGDHGVLLIGSAEPGAFSETDETIAKVLTSALTQVLTRIEREAELEQRNSQLEEFTSVVSHDLRNPLSVAKGHLDLARETGNDDHLAEVERAQDRIERIIEDLLWLAREGRRIGPTHPVELSHVVYEAWANVETAAAVLDVTCERTVEADPNRLKQLFENLFRNAIEHGGTDVSVRVGLLEDGFFVEDDGPGIPEDERADVVEAGYSTALDGTGFGLSIVQTVVDAHGWELDLGEGADGGARFEIHEVQPKR